MKLKQQNDVELGRFISLILRHQPEKIGLTLDEHGWAVVSDLIKGITDAGIFIDSSTLKRIVATNSKKRYVFNEDESKIRANQGHSLKVDIELQQQTPPEFLYHGTGEKSVSSIMVSGIEKRSRAHVHLSSNQETATQVGSRHGKPCILKIKAQDMANAGYSFYLSVNQVWLTDFVPVAYIELTE